MELVVGRESRVVEARPDREFFSSESLIEKDSHFFERYDQVIFSSFSKSCLEKQKVLRDLAERLSQHWTRDVVFLSSDHVFNGNRGMYTVDDQVSPNTLYGKYKVELESILKKFTIIRFTTTGPSFTNRALLDEMIANKSVRTLYPAQYFSPVETTKVNQLISLPNRKPGIYHLAGPRVSKSEYVLQRTDNRDFDIDSSKVSDHSLREGFKCGG